MTIGWRVMSLNTELWHLVISPRRREYTFNPSNEQPPANYLKYWFSASVSWSWYDLDLSYYKGSSLAAEFATSIRDPCKPSKTWTGGTLKYHSWPLQCMQFQGTIDVQNELHLTLTCPHHRNTCFISFGTLLILKAWNASETNVDWNVALPLYIRAIFP